MKKIIEIGLILSVIQLLTLLRHGRKVNIQNFTLALKILTTRFKLQTRFVEAQPLFLQPKPRFQIVFSSFSRLVLVVSESFPCLVPR